MSVSDIIKGACEQSGGTYSGGACRCSDGSLRNINTGECVRESDAPLVPIDFQAETERREMDDVDTSPRLLGSRERIAVTTRDEINARLQAGMEVATGGPAITPASGGIDFDALIAADSARIQNEASAREVSERVDRWRLLRRSDNPEATGTSGSFGGSGDAVQEPAGDAPKIPIGLVLAVASFIVFRS